MDRMLAFTKDIQSLCLPVTKVYDLPRMEADDEAFVVIVGDEDEVIDTGNFIQEAHIKEEYMDESTGLIEVEDLIETVKQYGVLIDLDADTIVKNEPYYDIETKIEYDDDDDEGDQYDVGEGDPYSAEERFNSKEMLEGAVDDELISSDGRRHRMVQPCQRKSYIKEMKLQNPELRENRKLLIETLAQIMKNVKPPPPPEKFCKKTKDGFSCLKCRKKTISLPAATRHYTEKHGPRYLICYACGVDFRSATNLYKHEKRCSAPDAVTVLKARAIYVGSKGRSRPFLRKVKRGKKKYVKKNQGTQKRKFQCNYCSASFSSKQSLIPHINVHNGLRPYHCSDCPASYASRTTLLRHFTKRHTNVQFICDHCNRSFSVKWALVAHLATHEPLKKYPCHLCDKRYAQKHALLLHMNKKHYNLPPPCACEICPRRFPRMSILKTHMKKEHGLALITRNMFFKSLPLLPEPNLQQDMVVLKTKTEDDYKDFDTTHWD